jgi:hypothetical protein
VTLLLFSFRAMQFACFYRFGSLHPFSGNADRLLLPFSLPPHLFGQCSSLAFTVLAPSTLFLGNAARLLLPFSLPSIPFRAMQTACFYRFSSLFPFSGNAAAQSPHKQNRTRVLPGPSTKSYPYSSSTFVLRLRTKTVAAAASRPNAPASVPPNNGLFS